MNKEILYELVDLVENKAFQDVAKQWNIDPIELAKFVLSIKNEKRKRLDIPIWALFVVMLIDLLITIFAPIILILSMSPSGY